jgi:hypothetical protein
MTAGFELVLTPARESGIENISKGTNWNDESN